MFGFGWALPCYTGLCGTLLSQVTTRRLSRHTEVKIDYIPGVAFVAGRKYFKGISEKRHPIVSVWALIIPVGANHSCGSPLALRAPVGG